MVEEAQVCWSVVIRVRRPDDDKCGGLSLTSDNNHSTVQLFNYSTYISELTVITEESVEKVLFLESDIDNDILMQQRPCVIFSDFPR